MIPKIKTENIILSTGVPKMAYLSEKIFQFMNHPKKKTNKSAQGVPEIGSS